MSKQINYYEFPARSPEITELQTLFKRHLSKFNVPFFEAGSEAEQFFLTFCKNAGFPIHRRTILEHEPRQRDDAAQYLFLMLKDDRGLCIPEKAIPAFIDVSSGCPGSETFGLCQRGAKQTRRPMVPEEGVRLLDQLNFVVARSPILAPKIYLISEKLARIMNASRVTGCEITPCDAPSPCYQLQIVARTRGRVRVGQARISRRCPVCGSVVMGTFSRERYFLPGDLENADFQLCDTYETENAGTFTIPFGFPIVSRRIFDLLLENHVKGLDRYTTDPPVKYAVVQIEPTI